VRQVALLIEKEQQRFGRLGDSTKSKFFKHLKSSLYSYINSIATCRGKEGVHFISVTYFVKFPSDLQ
jgi:hypothetical protein